MDPLEITVSSVGHILRFIIISVGHRPYLPLSDIYCVFWSVLSDTSSCGHNWLCWTYLAGTGPTCISVLPRFSKGPYEKGTLARGTERLKGTLAR